MLPAIDAPSFLKDEDMSHCDHMDTIATWLVAFAAEHRATHVFIEQYAYNMFKQANKAKLVELGGVVKHQLWKHWGVETQAVVASQARKLIAGKLPSKDKKVYTQQFLLSMGTPHHWSGDVMDAFVVANYGRHVMGWPAFATE